MTIVLISGISAKTIYVSYPEEVEVGKEFNIEVELEGFEEKDYDLKLDVFCDETRVSRVFVEEKWKSTNYWINSAIEDEEEFLMKVEKGEGKCEMIVKLREKDEVVDVKCKINIGVFEDDEENCEIEFDEEKPEENLKEKTEEELDEIEKVEIIENNFPKTNQIIKLGNSKKTEEILYESSVEKIKKYFLLSFGLFSIVAGFWILKNDR
jgi:hypothetical protein